MDSCKCETHYFIFAFYNPDKIVLLKERKMPSTEIRKKRINVPH